MVTSNLWFGCCGEAFADGVVATAIVDRLVHHAEALTLSDNLHARRRELITKDRSHSD